MTTEREYQEWQKKRQKLNYKSRQDKPVLLWLLGLLVLSALVSIKTYQPTYNLPASPSSAPTSNFINEQQI